MAKKLLEKKKKMSKKERKITKKKLASMKQFLCSLIRGHSKSAFAYNTPNRETVQITFRVQINTTHHLLKELNLSSRKRSDKFERSFSKWLVIFL